MEELLAIDGLTKHYPGVVASDDVRFTIAKGQIHALFGENGAGKSTLVKMIYGLVKPDKGTMNLDGRPYAPLDPRSARACGVAMVFQHFSLFDALSVAENIALGMDKPPKMHQLAEQITHISMRYGLPLDPLRLIGDLSAGERQRVEIIRCLLQNPRLLIMDEPTSVLTPQEVEILFATLQKLSDEGTAILYISHKLEEIRSLCQQATVLRLGKVVGRCVPAEKSAQELAEMMVGTHLQPPQKSAKSYKGKETLKVDDLSMPAQSTFGVALKNISFELKEGEILGIAGVAGNGQDELLLALSGEVKSPRGSIWVSGQPIGNLSIDQRRKRGLLACPEERLGHAAVPIMSLTENAYLTARERMGLKRLGFVRHQACADFAQKVVRAFDVRTPSVDNQAQSLSGGNLQKFVIGREILQSPDVLVVNQPTWGVDAAAAAAIRQALIDLSKDGACIVVISQDLDELLEIADYFAALNAGELSVIRKTKGLNIEMIGMMMGGAETTAETTAETIAEITRAAHV